MTERVREPAGVRTQNLRDFAVQIRRADNNAIVGTGIAVSTDGKIFGHVESPPKRILQEEPVQLESNQINRGMSGAPVLEEIGRLGD